MTLIKLVVGLGTLGGLVSALVLGRAVRFVRHVRRFVQRPIRHETVEGLARYPGPEWTR